MRRYSSGYSETSPRLRQSALIASLIGLLFLYLCLLPPAPLKAVEDGIFANLLQGMPSGQPVHAARFFPQAPAVLLSAFSASLLFSLTPITTATFVTFVAVALLWIGSRLGFAATGEYLPPLLPSLAALTVWKVYATISWFTQRRRVHVSEKEILSIQKFITFSLSNAIAARDRDTGKHAVRIQGYLRSLCDAAARRPHFSAALTPNLVDLLVQLAPIHDVGKVGVPDYILHKPTTLTGEEFKLMKSHVELGKKILEQARIQAGLEDGLFFQLASDIVYSHHERWDGTGYPLGLRGEHIPLAGRLLSIADVYDALVSKRDYKSEYVHADAVAAIRSASGTQFDPELVAAFLDVEESWCEMTNAHRTDPLRVASA